jgi:DNA-directed RNA polymerase specialized sigma24 family protein
MGRTLRAPAANGRPRIPTPTPACADVDRRVGDLRLVREILAGSAEAWAQFIARYTGLIASVIRRYLRPRDADELQTVFVDVLVSLHERKLATYQGRAALSTWITVVTRSEVLDEIRRRHGRYDVSRRLRGLDPSDRMIYALYYVEGRGLRDVLDRLRLHEPGWTLERVLARMRAIEDTLDERLLRRRAYDLRAHSIGAASGRMLEYLDHVRQEHADDERTCSPEYLLMEREARQVVERVSEILASLDARDRLILDLRFERGWSAERIADELGLRPRRRVYTVIDRILRGLRRRVLAPGGPPR